MLRPGQVGAQRRCARTGERRGVDDSKGARRYAMKRAPRRVGVVDDEKEEGLRVTESERVRILAIRTLSDDWYVLKKTTFDFLRRDGTWADAEPGDV